MAQKRMFSLQVTDTDRFLDKPLERRPKPPTQEEHATSATSRLAKAANRSRGDEMRPIVIDFTAQLDGKTLVRQMVPIMRNEARAMGV